MNVTEFNLNAAKSMMTVGVVVELRSGGPAMTVSDLKREDDLICVEWFVNDLLQRDAFHPLTLYVRGY